MQQFAQHLLQTMMKGGKAGHVGSCGRIKVDATHPLGQFNRAFLATERTCQLCLG